MNSSSPVRVPACQEVRPSLKIGPSLAAEYRRSRQHLYPLEDFELAVVVGGLVRSFCGIEVEVITGSPGDLAEAFSPEDGDCVSCVDLWLDRSLIRL